MSAGGNDAEHGPFMRALDVLCVLLAVLSGAILLALIGLTFTDVVLRYVFAAPILGAGDVLQIGMVLVIAFAIPFTWRAGGHIVMDLIPDYGSERLTRLRDLAVRSIGVVIFAPLAWQAWERAADAALFNEATNMIEIPFEPFFHALAAAAAFKVLVLGIEIVRILAGRSIDFTLLVSGMEEAEPEAG